MQESQTQNTLQLTCSFDKPVKLFCSTPNCTFSSLICRNNDCQCLPTNHRNCEFVYADALYENVLKKKKSLPSQLQSAVDKIQEVYNQAIQKLSKDRQSLLSWKQNFGLSGDQIMFLEMIQGNEKNQITGKLINKIKSKIEDVPQYSWLTQDFATNFWKNEKVNFNRLFGQLNYFHKSTVSTRFMQKLPALPSSIKRDSQKVIQFLGRPVNKFKLLYRASQSDFQISKFQASCGKIKNTLTLILTEHDKIIGGFNPNSWSNNSDPFEDLLGSCVRPRHENQEFIFSLSQNQKYCPINKQADKIINYDSKNGPTFGGKFIDSSRHNNYSYYGSGVKSQFDIKISDKANTNLSNFDFPVTFNNGKHYKGQQSAKMFCGSSNKQCLIKQWQVFEVQFDE